MVYLLVTVVVVLVLLVLFLRSKFFRKKLRGFQWNSGRSYVRLYPNPGFQSKKRRYSRHYGYKRRR